MDTTLTLIDLAGSIALLLWGVHMVQSGIQRAFGPHLRRFLGRAVGGRWQAFLAGLGVTAVLQSSTATGLMAASFAAGGLVDLVPALAVMLGANIGSALNPLLEGAAGGDAVAKRVPAGNLLNRLIGGALGLALLNWAGPLMVTIEPDPARAVADFHTVFNLVMALAFLPFLRPLARL